MDDFRLAFAADDRTAGQQGIPRLFDHRIGFAGEKGFIDLQLTGEDGAVGADLLSALQQQNIPLFHLLNGDVEVLLTADYITHRHGKKGKLLHQFFSL